VEIVKNYEVSDDPNVSRQELVGGCDAPDFLIGGAVAIDVIPDTEASRQGHLERDYISSAQQLISYPVPETEFLDQILDC